MSRFLRLTLVLLLVFVGTTSMARPPKLDLNDVTWLWPVPQNTNDVSTLISIGSLNSEDGRPVWTDEQFQDVLLAADSDAAKVGGNRIRLPTSVRDKQVWRIAAFRVDPTAPGGHQIIRQMFGEKPQLRMTLQPVTVVNGRVEVHDITIHLVYNFVTGAEGEAVDLPDRDRFRRIVNDLDGMKKLVLDAGIETNGKPLSVHPGLAADVPGLREQVTKFLSRNLRAEDLGAMAVMGLDGPEPWIFLALGKSADGGGRFGPLEFLPA